MKAAGGVLLIFLLASLSGCAVGNKAKTKAGSPEFWRAVHLLGYDTDIQLAELGKKIPSLAAMGINTVILEFDYNFEFTSHHELRRGTDPLTKEAVERFADLCEEHQVRRILEFQSLGHQSWEEEIFPLLTQYPELDLTPGAFPGNKDIYCREWDVTNPRVYQIVYALLDEQINAFRPAAVHVGMDEVFLLGSDQSPSTKGQNPAVLYAQAVKDMHHYIVKKRGLEMMMWGDRLIDGKTYPYGEWESSENGTWPAVDMIPKDIIICDWHYEPMESYPSLPMFIEKGFRVLPTSWRNVKASRALIKYSLKFRGPKMLGHLFTMWSNQPDPSAYPPLVKGIKLLK